MPLLIFFETEDWAFCQHRLNLARFMRDSGFSVGLISPTGSKIGQIEKEGFKHYPIRMQRTGMNPVSELYAIIQIVKILRRENPDIIHSIALKSVLYGTIAARLAGARAIVNSITGLGYVFIPGGVKRKLLKLVIETLLKVALSSKRVRNIFQNPDDFSLFKTRQLVHADRCIVVRGSGVDTKRFNITPEPAGMPVVLLASRLLWDKGIGELIEAARALKTDGLQFRLILAGEPDTANPASIPAATLETLKTEGLVELPGFVTDMAGIIAQSNIACLPSYREGLPLFLLEAAASGRACITTDVPGCREVIRDRENGLLVPVRNSEALAVALKVLLTDPTMRKRMGENGRELAVAEFSKEIVAGQVLSLYNSLLGKKKID